MVGRRYQGRRGWIQATSSISDDFKLVDFGAEEASKQTHGVEEFARFEFILEYNCQGVMH